MSAGGKNSKVQAPATKWIPPNAGKGRKKGIPNKNTKALKDMILGALEGAGGEEYLKKQAITNPGPFLTLIGKVLPTQITGDGGGPLQFENLTDDELKRKVDMLLSRINAKP